MHNFLTDKVADYTGTGLDIPSTTILPQTGKKTQVLHEFDDGTVSVIGISSDNYFDVVLQWNYITPTEYDTLLSLWHSESKAAGMRRTFYWDHPVDGQVYTVRFMGPITPSYNEFGYLTVAQVSIRVEGNKP